MRNSIERWIKMMNTFFYIVDNDSLFSKKTRKEKWEEENWGQWEKKKVIRKRQWIHDNNNFVCIYKMGARRIFFCSFSDWDRCKIFGSVQQLMKLMIMSMICCIFLTLWARIRSHFCSRIEFPIDLARFGKKLRNMIHNSQKANKKRWNEPMKTMSQNYNQKIRYCYALMPNGGNVKTINMVNSYNKLSFIVECHASEWRNPFKWCSNHPRFNNQQQKKE